MIDPTQLAIAIASFFLLLTFATGGFFGLMWVLFTLIFPRMP